MTKKEEQVKETLQEIAKSIEEKLPENYGFTLLTYEFGEDKRLFYVSNSQRQTVMSAMAEFLQKNLDNSKMFGKDV